MSDNIKAKQNVSKEINVEGYINGMKPRMNVASVVIVIMCEGFNISIFLIFLVYYKFLCSLIRFLLKINEKIILFVL